MNCASAIDLMLEAELRDLTDDGELASHIAECERCRTIADEIVEGQMELARELDAISPRLGVEEALKRADRSVSVARRRAGVWQIGAPLAAAAGIVGIAITSGGSDNLENMVQARAPEALPGLELESPPGRDVAVFEVADRPDVVVVWFFHSGDD